MKKILIFAVIFAGCIAHAEFVTDWRSGWRLTAGGQFNFNAKGSLRVKSGGIHVPQPSSVSTKSAAKEAGDALSIDKSGRTDFGNGAFVDAADSAGGAGETWNWFVPAGQLNGGTMTLANGYAERSTSYQAFGGVCHDENVMAGAAFGLDRAIWRHGNFGVELGFNFGFFLRDNFFRGSAGGVTRTDTYRDGSYLTDVDFGNAEVMGDPWTRNADGSFGAGSFGGPGPVIDLDGISISHRWGEESVRSESSASGPFSVRGDLQMCEFQLALKPYYELTEWFMIRGTLGVGLDYRNFDVRVSGCGKSSCDDWDCYMVYGLGGLFHWKDICLGFDFLGKAFDDGLDVNSRYVSGSIDNAKWEFRVYVGYEF